MNLLNIFSFFGCKSKPVIEIIKIEYPPFTIQMETEYTKSFNMNVGKRVTNSHVNYSILYKGEKVVFPEDLQTNTGYTHLWKVYILENYSKPALIAGSQSLYLIIEENDKAVIKPIEVQGTDFASLQFLDVNEGQPADAFEVYMDNSPSEIQKLKGGDYLLVGKHTVMYIPDFKFYTFNKNNEDVDNYSFESYKGAVAFSPDKRWIVFPGSFQTWNTNKEPDFNNALVVYNYMEDTGYTVPIDQTKTRLKDITYINTEWLNTYFEWEKNNSGSYKYKNRQLEKLPFWLGKFEEDGKVYELSPVKEEMQNLLAGFILKELNLKQENITEGDQYTSGQINIIDGDLKFTLWYRPEDKMLVFMQDIPAQNQKTDIEAIRKIGELFNVELSKGKHQDYFTEY